jgi:D-alanine--poly(phosphoribitol) ligase subunit 1
MYINILQYLKQSAEKMPSKQAFIDENGSVTFAQIQEMAQRLGSYLGKIARPKTPVLVLMEKSRFVPACFMGVVAAGCFYVPIDADLPDYRLNLILDTIGSDVMITDEKTSAKVSRLNFSGRVILAQEAFCAPIDHALLASIEENHTDTDALYVVFTSGSTGTPKGVVTTHRAVIDLMEAMAFAFDFGEDEIFGNQAPFDYDGSVKDIYNTLKHGATTYIIPRPYFSFPKMLMDCLNEQKITTLFWAVSAVCVPINLGALEYAVPKHLKRILYSGAVMPNKHLMTWQQYCPEVMYVNLYGPTESTCNCTYHIIGHAVTLEERMPIGKPFRNTEILLLDQEGKTPARGEMGEICVKGSSIALGYYNNPEKTSEVFVQNPLNASYPEIIYKTGDLGSYGEEGLLLFHGREDSQIKHMGHRIELGEIETVVSSMDSVNDAVCIYDAANSAIVLFFTGEGADRKTVALNLRAHLPKYMLPARFVHMDAFPRKLNGKVDRQALKEQYLAQQS